VRIYRAQSACVCAYIYCGDIVPKENSWIKYEYLDSLGFQCNTSYNSVQHVFNTTTHLFLKTDEIKSKLARQRPRTQHGRRFSSDASQLVLYLLRFEEFVDVEMFHQPTEARRPSTFLAVPVWFV
jgi:hypothetical protein